LTATRDIDYEPLCHIEDALAHGLGLYRERGWIA
jgi:hypothetical protein